MCIKFTVLVVENSREIKHTLKNIFKSYTDLNILFSCSGEDALILLANKKIDLVLTALKLPDITGVTLGIKIKEIFPNKPVILFTTYSADFLRTEASNVGVEYWSKSDMLKDSNVMVKSVFKILNMGTIKPNIPKNLQYLAKSTGYKSLFGYFNKLDNPASRFKQIREIGIN